MRLRCCLQPVSCMLLLSILAQDSKPLHRQHMSSRLLLMHLHHSYQWAWSGLKLSIHVAIGTACSQAVQCHLYVCACRTGYTRVIVEKPFGKDSESFRQLSTDLYQHLTEDQMFRIDHYLGKELIENLTVCFETVAHRGQTCQHAALFHL